MVDASSTPVPPQTQQQFPDLVALIMKSESMNNEERKYWLSILPAMTPEQRKTLEEILVNERDQLAAIDQKYAASQKDAMPSVADIDASRRGKREERTQKEKQAEEEDTEKEEEVMKEIETL